ncbi:DNA cytosine methyltransferase [Polaribacter cellanae]|uniref:Cytosine-specific methyltransferase n=1 Tax=Polaribacter cellanae TaxID=2818493 RepID=A0A975CQ71_9FLAO|nr:DNA (cytosine-5-)-methyltransferase [Polaribacter cellanae]QTE23320.1 DNA (cytosine-5-)-methyltransferase [Polaribacter cellanae]
MSKTPIRVVELFAGVGGFRIALEDYPKKKSSDFEVVWSNQFEPRTKKQHANIVYKNRFLDANHSEENFENIVSSGICNIPKHDLLVGGFPCQDFSIANRTANKGLDGKKGKLWWSIETFLKQLKNDAPDYLLLENVDRLLLSPSFQRGRDFAVILTSLNNLGYAVEWRVINAADYGFPQRRRRVFILGYRKGTALYKKLKNTNPKDWLIQEGITAKAFPVTSTDSAISGIIPNSTEKIMNSFSNKNNRFKKVGLIINGMYYTQNIKPKYDGKKTTLGDVLLDKKLIPESFYIKEEDIPKWKICKGAKSIHRISKYTGKPYIYREGNVPFPDKLDKPARTMLTREGGTYIAREKHVIKVNGRYRRLHPIELERLNGFPDDFTKCDGITDIQRAFFMGNALVIGIIEKLGKELSKAVSC